MNASTILSRLGLLELDAVTAKELARFIERKLDDQAKIKGQIAKDLRRIGEFAFLDPSAYDQLKDKYLAAKALGGKKKIAILEQMKHDWCKE